LYNPPGVTVQQALNPPYPAMEIARWAVFQLQIVVANGIMVFPPPKVHATTSAVTDYMLQQIYRMYHFFDRNLLVCVVPSITTAAYFGEFVFPRVPRPPSFVTQFQFRSRRLWSDEPTSTSHNTVRHNSSGKMDYSLLLYLNIVSFCECR
jgi:hypothetical protein